MYDNNITKRYVKVFKQTQKEMTADEFKLFMKEWQTLRGKKYMDDLRRNWNK